VGKKAILEEDLKREKPVPESGNGKALRESIKKGVMRR